MDEPAKRLVGRPELHHRRADSGRSDARLGGIGRARTHGSRRRRAAHPVVPHADGHGTEPGIAALHVRLLAHRRPPCSPCLSKPARHHGLPGTGAPIPLMIIWVHGPGPAGGRGSWAGYVAPVALSHWTLTEVTPGAGMAQTPRYQVTDPATGEVSETFPFATDAEVAEALAAATEAFAAWRLRPVTERAAVVKRVAELFTERAADLAALITKEMGKRPAQAVGEAEFCTDIFNYYADNGPALLADKPLPGHDTARVEYRPVGPVLGVMPWNYPYYQVARFAAPNLIVGNTVILKHAENCPASALAIAQIMKDAGVPDGVYVNLFATHEQVAAMIADPRLRGVSLTGSERAGTAVAETAGRNLKKVVLELGGSDPYIILDTDDVEGAAKTAWVTRMENVGQACNSNKRMIVMDDIYDDFVAALVKRATAMSPRQPGDDSPRSYSPMVSRKAAENLLAQVQDAVSKGATL